MVSLFKKKIKESIQEDIKEIQEDSSINFIHKEEQFKEVIQKIFEAIKVDVSTLVEIDEEYFKRFKNHAGTIIHDDVVSILESIESIKAKHILSLIKGK
jgi:hypothetical protein